LGPDAVAADPTGGTDVEPTLARVLRVTEELAVLGQVGDGADVGHHGLDAPLRVAFDHVGRHVPTLGRIGEVGAQVEDPAALQSLLHRLPDVVDPDLHEIGRAHV